MMNQETVHQNPYYPPGFDENELWIDEPVEDEEAPEEELIKDMNEATVRKAIFLAEAIIWGGYNKIPQGIKSKLNQQIYELHNQTTPQVASTPTGQESDTIPF